MKSRICLPVLAAAVVLVFTAPAIADNEAVAELKDQDGQTVGTVVLMQTPSGSLLHANFNSLAWGVHAFHIHAVGACEPPFKSAGPHLTIIPDKKHGLLNEAGPHAGDLPNIYVPASGVLEAELLAPGIDIDKHLLDADGSALVIHEGLDDYQTDPAGAAGPRIACGAVHK
jgi:Cu-Zn family superoxide dismutase